MPRSTYRNTRYACSGKRSPEVIKVDNGPEYTSNAICKWANEQGITLNTFPQEERWKIGI